MEDEDNKSIRRGLPSDGAIVNFWKSRGFLIAVDWSKAEKFCWRCGTTLVRGSAGRNSEDDGFRHKAHIIPRALGGADTLDNLIILCRRCHAEAPDVKDPEFVWEWLHKTMATSGWFHSRLREAFLDYEFLFGPFPFPSATYRFVTMGGDSSLVSLPDLLPREHNAEFVKRFERAFSVGLDKLIVCHPGYPASATLAWLIRQAVLYSERKPNVISAYVQEVSETTADSADTYDCVQKLLWDLVTEPMSPKSADNEPVPSEHEEESRVVTLTTTIERFLPDFVVTVKNASERADGSPIIVHQDAFATDYDDDEYILLGMAVKYAGLHGVTLNIIGKNGELSGIGPA